MYQLSPRAATAHHLVPFPRQHPLSGLGQAAQAQSILASAPQIAGGLYTAVTTSALIPIIGVGVAAVTLVLGLLFSRKGPKQKVATTAVANRVEPALQQNLAGYLAGPRTVSSQAQALANFDAGWRYLVEYCDCPEMGDPGKACVSDRQSGACTWKASPGSWNQDTGGNWKWTPAGSAGSGSACWNWFAGYRDPIANDPAVIPDPVLDASGNLVHVVTDPSTGQVTTVPFTGAGAGSGSSTYLLLGGALILGAILVGGS
jgi:hypothetical protein